MKKINIAIDGPSGVGKSTIAKIIAKNLDLVFINTGLMYRAIAFYSLKNNLDLNNEEIIEKAIKEIDIELLPNEIIKINGIDITDNLWVDSISIAASIISKHKKIREFCVKKQQQIAKEKPGVVMEGRDIGSVVLTDAELKIFLTATNEVRAQRRIKQLLDKGEKVNEEEILKNIIERDKRDKERDVAPLIKVDDAIEIDTSNLSFDEVLFKVLDLAKKKMI